MTRKSSTLLLALALSMKVAGANAEPSVIAGPITSPINHHQYYLLSPDTWTNSEAKARSLHGHLATIRNAAEQAWIFSTFSPYVRGVGNGLWIGLNAGGHPHVFTWIDGEQVAYTNWSPGEPSGRTGEDYGQVFGSDDPRAGGWNDQLDVNQFLIYGVVEVTACQVNACDISKGVIDNCVSLYAGIGLQAKFIPPSGQTLRDAASACNFRDFDWVQVVDRFSGPGPFAQNNPSQPLSIPPGLPFYDPPLGGYTYQWRDYALWSHVQPNFAVATPFYYSPLDIQTGCAIGVAIGPCAVPITYNNILYFSDRPENPCFPGGRDVGTPACGVLGPSDYMGFETQLVGVLPCSSPSVFCSGGFMPSAPLFDWSWKSNYTGSGGGVFDVFYDVRTANVSPDVPGSSGTGGVTITSINGIPQTPPSLRCSANPAILWPPNGKSVLVTVSGTVSPSTQVVVADGTEYAVIDKYGQVQPSGRFVLGAGGSYSFAVPLLAARNGDDQDGRKYTITVGVKDAIGNIGSCSAVVTVPHDQGN